MIWHDLFFFPFLGSAACCDTSISSRGSRPNRPSRTRDLAAPQRWCVSLLSLDLGLRQERDLAGRVAQPERLLSAHLPPCRPSRRKSHHPGTAAVPAWRPELVFMPHFGHSPALPTDAQVSGTEPTALRRLT